MEGEFKGCRAGVRTMQETVTRMQQQREGDGEAATSLARTRSWADDTEAMYVEGRVAGNIPSERTPPLVLIAR